MIDPQEHFIDRMTGFFQDPPGSNPKLFFDALCDDFSREIPYATAHQFREAVRWFRQNRKSRTFPTIAECIDAVRQQPYSPATAATLSPQAEKNDPWSFENERAGDELLRGTALARQAAEGGWLYPLWDFARTHKRLPDERELKAVLARGERLIRRRDECRRAPLPEPVKTPEPVGNFQAIGSFAPVAHLGMVADAIDKAEERALKRLFPRWKDRPLPQAAE